VFDVLEKRQRQCTPLPEWGSAAAPRRLRKNPLADEDDHCYLSGAVREIEEVVPVNAVSTWVLPSGVAVGR
jgi:hypothetical protein